MTLLVIEGFDNVTSSVDAFAGILTVANATSVSSYAVSAASQFGGQCLTVTTSNPLGAASAAYAAMHASTSSATVVIGSSILLAPAVNSGYDIGITDGSICQIFCRFILNGVSVYRGDPVTGSTTLIATAITGLLSSGWAYVEVRATIGTLTSGVVMIYINGNRVLNLTGLNTSNDGTALISGITLGAYDGSGGGFTACYDNVYMLDILGAAPNNTVLGPTRVVTRLPVANTVSGFTPLANTNWQEVAEISMDADTSYNYSTSIPATDTYSAFALPTTTSEVFAVQVKAAVRKDNTASRLMTTAVSSSGSNNAGASVALSPNYQYITDIYALDPHTGSSWSSAAVNLSSFGYTVQS